MKRPFLFMCTIAGFSLGAAELTITESTNLTENIAAGHIYANADITLPEGVTLTIDSGKYLYLPGDRASDVTLKVQKGDLGFRSTGSRIAIGEGGGSGLIDVEGRKDFCAYFGFIGGHAKVTDGYADILRIANGKAESGHWNRVYWKKWYNYLKTGFARIYFDHPGGALVGRHTDSEYLFDGQTDTGYAFEGINGADITFGIGSWWTSSTSKYLLKSGTPCSFKTIGTSDVVFHNHNDAEYKAFIVSADTNQFIWTHSGKTIVSNGCVLRVTADYALPNGAQTGILEFRGKANNRSVRPVIDLMGTTQIVNGINDATAYTTGAVTNGADTGATLIFGAHDEDAVLCAGNVYGNIEIRKTGPGSMTVQNTLFHGNDITVEDGVLTLANGDATVSAGAVNVSGGRLVVDGCRLSCDSITTSGDGEIELLNGGSISDADLQSCSFIVDSAADTTVFSAADLGGTGVLSIMKTGTGLLTAVPGQHGFGAVDIREGTLRPCGTVSKAEYWRFTFTNTVNNAALNVRIKPDGVEVPITITPVLSLNRLHMFGPAADHIDAGIGYAGELNVPASELPAGKCTANMPFIDTVIGFGDSLGGTTASPGRLHDGFSNWYSGVIFTNSLPLSVGNPLVYTFRLPAGRAGAAGYLFSRCVNNNAARPYDWTVEASENGTDWVTMDRRTATDGADNGSQTYGHDGVPFLFSEFASDWRFEPSGPVKVAAGATLDTSEVPYGNIRIASLEIDVSVGAGTITRFVPASEGTLAFTGVSDQDLSRWIEGFAIGSIVDEANLDNWKVSVNGEIRNDYRVRLNGQGLLCARRITGLTVTVK